MEEMLTIVIPVADYQKFVSSSPNLNPPDANGISNMNTGGFITQVGNFAFVKSPKSYNNLLAMKKSAGAAEFKSLAASLDSAPAAQAASALSGFTVICPRYKRPLGRKSQPLSRI